MENKFKKVSKNAKALIVGLCLILIIALFTFLKPSFQGKNSASKSIAPADQAAENIKKATPMKSSDLAKKMIANKSLTVIDLRPEDSFKIEHILNSINISSDHLADAIGALDKNKTYVLLDDGLSPQIVGSSINLLSQNGFKNLFYLDGGFLAWKSQYNPTISEGDPNSFTDQSKVNYVNSDNLKNMMAKESNLYIIDLRSNDQFAVGHLKNSVNIYLDDLEKRKNEIPLGKKIILSDADGLGAFKGAVRLFDMGFFNTFALSDGLDGWKKKNFEIVK